MIDNQTLGGLTLGLLVAALVACGGDDPVAGAGGGGAGGDGGTLAEGGSGATTSTGGTGGTGGAGGAGGSGGGEATSTLTTVQVLVDGTGTIPGMSVCIMGTRTCATTDPLGYARLDVPDDLLDLAFEIDHPAVYPTLVPIRPLKDFGYDDAYVLVALNKAGIAVDNAALGFTADPTKAIVAQGVTAPGATVTLDPASGEGPFYSTDDPSAATIVEDFYVFGNVDPGEVVVTMHDAPGACLFDVHWSGPEGNAWRAPTMAGRMTFIPYIDCTP